MKRICKNCMSWEEEKDEIRGTCNLAEHDGMAGVSADCMIAIQDAEMYSAILKAHPNFGCNQWVKGE